MIEEALIKMQKEILEEDAPRPGMTRKERRKWYYRNRKKFNLPLWKRLLTDLK